MVKTPDDRLSADTEMNVPTAKVTLVRRECLDPFEITLTPHHRYQLEMGLRSASLNTRVCYQEHWGSQRFDPVGNVFLLPPGKSVLMRHAGGKAHALIRCQIDPAVITDRLGSPLKWTAQRLLASLDIRDAASRRAAVCPLETT
jgi:AraC family transcriptional regulator